MKSVKIIIATHKSYRMPKDEIYLPMQVGAALHKSLGYEKDNTGDNISDKNNSYCELTGLYWGWKNLDTDYKGLVHYRRYFTLSKNAYKNYDEKLLSILTGDQLNNLINNSDESKNYDLILPKKRNYVIETLYSHYKHTLHITPLNYTRDIIAEECPEFLSEFDQIEKRKSAHMFNMMIAKKEIYDEYCEWLFNILFKLEDRLKDNPKIKKYNSFHMRFYGRISELLLDVWLYTKYPELKNHKKESDLRVKELRVVNVEKINWIKKSWNFLMAKLTGKKYGEND